MRFQQTAEGLAVWAPAKLNLFLEVLSKRDDGFHELETLMAPIDLYDTLTLREEASGRIEFVLENATGRGPTSVPGDTLTEGPDNLVVRALELARDRLGVRRGVRASLLKRIPVASGLAGGSSDAAAALVGVCRLWQQTPDLQTLTAWAAALGSDVPFFLVAGAAVCRGRGERVEPVDAGPRLDLVVVRPPAGLSTAAVFGRCEPALSPAGVKPVCTAWQQGRVDRLGRLLWNRLQPAAARLSPWIDRLQGVFAAMDVLGHSLSGSGTSYFALCRHARHARHVAAQVRARNLGRVYVVRTGE